MSRSAKMPGWKMTRDQARHYWTLWTAACRAQAWDKLPSAERDEKRYDVLAQLGYASVKAVDSTSGFDRLKSRLLELADRVSAESDDAGQRRRILYAVGKMLADASDAGYDLAIDRILRQRFKIAPGVRDITDLPTEELTNLARTLKNRLTTLNGRHRLVGILALAGFLKSRQQDLQNAVFDRFKDPFQLPNYQQQNTLILAS